MHRLCGFYSGICLKTEEKAWKNLSHGSRRVPPDTPLDLFLWCHIKALIYTWKFDSEEDLNCRIVKEVATIRQQCAIFECTRQSILRLRRRRCRLCIEIWGLAFERLF